jgi:hypothetical protein
VREQPEVGEAVRSRSAPWTLSASSTVASTSAEATVWSGMPSSAANGLRTTPIGT